MTLPKRYKPDTTEPELEARWQESGVYHFDPESDRPVFSIDTPPPTVSGHLHLGHVYSYSHADFIARFRRMNGYNVFYPMGYDDNGLPTERLVERRHGVRASEIGRRAFIDRCLAVSEEAEQAYQRLWKRLGLSVDWRYTYRTIDDASRRTSQWAFIDLYQKGRAYRRKAPTIWCPECQTAIAQAELDDLEREGELVTLAFRLDTGETLPIATTRPELLPACVAIFVHPDDDRYTDLVGRQVQVPLFDQLVSVLVDAGADPQMGTGAVMCCTFGDSADVEWWHTHELPLAEVIDRAGRLTERAGRFAGRSVQEARHEIVDALEERGLLLDRTPTSQSVRVHERCDTPVEYVVTRQWYVRVLEERETWLQAGEELQWHPPHMQARYRAWVENLGWDWCISRQRYFGVPFPVWYCDACGETVLADAEQLPVDPGTDTPAQPCTCGSTSFTPETDVMDTWATSSLTPLIVGRLLDDPAFFDRVFPMSLRPQAHEIIRTWAFYTIVRARYHVDALPWKNVLISGWGLAPEGMGKISKSRGGGPMAPLEMIQRYSADAVRYWAASTGPGKDSVISEEKIQAGARLVTKLWNVARFSHRFLDGYTPGPTPPDLTPADRWILSRTQGLVHAVTAFYRGYNYAAAQGEIEAFFWRDLADNYLEMGKKRLYDADSERATGARFALYHALLTTLKLFAPVMPYVTEVLYCELFAAADGADSIHRAEWPQVNAALVDETADVVGATLVEIATAVRRYKSANSISLAAELARLEVAPADASFRDVLHDAEPDVTSVTRAQHFTVVDEIDPRLETVSSDGIVSVALRR